MAEIKVDRLAGPLDYRGMTVRYMPHMPELQGVSGKGRYEGGTLHFDVASGGTVGLKTAGATIDLTGLDGPAPQHAAIRMPIGGSRVARQIGLCPDAGGLLGELAGDLAAEHGGGDGGERGQHAGAGRLRLALRRVARGDVADLVAQHARHLGLGLRQGQQAARDVDVAARQREGVGNLAVEQGEGELGVGLIRVRGYPVADRLDVGLKLFVRVGAAELLQDARNRGVSASGRPTSAGASLLLPDRSRSTRCQLCGCRSGW
jgi:hypothetical protein